MLTAEATVRVLGVVLIAPRFRGSVEVEDRSKAIGIRSSSRTRVLNDSINAFCVGFPGWMKSSSTSCSSAQTPDGAT